MDVFEDAAMKKDIDNQINLLSSRQEINRPCLLLITSLGKVGKLD